MRFTRLLLLSFTLLVSLTVHAQSFELLSSLRLTEETMSVRGAAMGNVSIDDPALDPTALAKLEHPLFSLGASRVEFNLLDSAVASQTRDAIALSHALVAIPVGNFTVSAHYRASPELRGDVKAGPGGSAAFEPYLCTFDSCLLSMFTEQPMFERRERRYGASVAWERGPLAIGGGAEVHELHEESAYGRVAFVSVGSPLPPPAPRFDLVVRRTSGREIVPNAAVRWTFSPRASLAVAYNGAATFERVDDTCTIDYNPSPHCVSEYARLGTSTRSLADAFRVSATIVPLDNLTLVAEAVRRNYANLGADEIDAFNAYRDVTELHAGAEYRTGNLALRAGWWRDPARWDPAYWDPARGLGARQDHVTLGAGINAGPARIDFAVDDADMPSLRRASVGITFGGLGARGR
ncbi:MAG: hypothetical protein QOJ98_823 [Acidobacteriota bacterium]|jgi:hypothetical protein|nr:hypothetical protein [Acidobacteriota bacterium]